MKRPLLFQTQSHLLTMRKPLHDVGNRPCPHCHRTISANKEMCWAGVTEFGTVEAFLEAKQAELLKAAA